MKRIQFIARLMGMTGGIFLSSPVKKHLYSTKDGLLGMLPKQGLKLAEDFLKPGIGWQVFEVSGLTKIGCRIASEFRREVRPNVKFVSKLFLF